MQQLFFSSSNSVLKEVPKSFSVWVKCIEESSNEVARRIIELLETGDIDEALEIYMYQEHKGILLN
ncbi:hypothetical protein LAT59_01220 [Candidatus Gracilibacteria bacterium]|nr:hypothetical protein [Candidatus Gracilibacteria bacterium]